ncbi:ATP-binding protein [Cerasicoccus fimbriatus]|uniref:ATP-binding protein n=1 Tax=Cerasicoccus fimbriatus TaxID=3014554 RepID=UPI0022B4EA1C|nr:ATP-binding protein [Cerasicoccus sp. TK19100]
MTEGESIRFKRLTRLISENFGAFFAVIALDGKILHFDLSKAAILGLQADKLIGYPVYDQILPGIHREMWPLSCEVDCDCFPLVVEYTKVDKTVLWDAEIDLVEGNVILLGNVVEDASNQSKSYDLLAERVRRHDRLMGNLPGMVYRCRLDRDWTMEYVSEGVVALTGYSREELQSGEISWGEDLIIAEDRDYTWNTVLEALSKQEAFVLYYRIKTKSGAIRTIWERGVGIFDAEGKVTALEGFIANATPLVEAQSELRITNTKLNNILNAATETVVIMTDTDGVITTFNRGAEKLLHHRAEEMVGKETPIAIHEPAEVITCAEELTAELGEPVSGFETFVAYARRGLPDRRVWTFVRKDGSKFKVDLIVTAVRNDDGEIIGFLWVAEDITNQLQVQDDLRLAKERAEASNRAKDEFLAVISHEMRTPLNPILGFSNMLLQDCEDEEAREGLEIIERSAYKLLHQIEDILNFIGIDKQKTKVELKPTQVWTYSHNVVRDLESMSNGNEFSVVNGCDSLAPAIDKSLTVLLDSELTSQILSNLITNAFKFTLRGKVCLHVGWRDEDGGVLRYEVSDTGIGIPRDKHDTIFQPFTQVESNYTRRYEGVGLGLAICSKLIEVLNGRMAFQSEIGVGSTFWFELPAVRVDGTNGEATAEEMNAQLFSKFRVLVVEDNLDNRKLIVGFLQKIGADVMTAPDGPTAVERCRQYDFHVVLMDISMPEMDGFETTQQIFAGCSTEPKVIAVTAHASEDVKQKCAAMGMVDFLPKPVTLESLRTVLESHWSLR